MNTYLKLVSSRIALLALAVALAVPMRPALASHISCGAVLTKDTKLDRDLINCPGDGLVIGADHITITLNGHSISGTGAPGSAGIRNSGHDHVTIADGDFMGLDIGGFEIGILQSGVRNNRVHSLFIEGSSFGIAFFNSDHNRVEGNIARGGFINQCGQVMAAGIALFNSDHNRIRENMAELTDVGIALVNSDHNRVEHNQAAPAESDGNACFGIVLRDGSDDNYVRANLASQNRGSAGDGIFVSAGSSGNRIEDNLATFNSDDGIDVDEPTTTIANNTANNNDDLGIEAVAGVRDGGGNSAQGNGNPAQCLNVNCAGSVEPAATDLDVTYIERTPRYSRYAVEYTTQDGAPFPLPRLCPGTETNKHWPNVGEAITYTAHVRNKGSTPSPAFAFAWLVNGTIVAQSSAAPLSAGAEATILYQTTWPSAPQAIEFRVDPDNAVAETAETNNALTIGSHDLTISIWVEQGLYDIFNRTPNLVGSASFEDWVQAQFARMNERFRQAQYPGVSPAGIRDRVRIDKLIVAPELDGLFPFPAPVCATEPADPEGFLIDGSWGFADGDPTNAAGSGGVWQSYVDQFATTIDWGLIHELAHQLGVIDLYRMNLVNDPKTNYHFQVQDRNGQVIPASQLPTYGFNQLLFQYPGLMAGGDTQPYKDGTYFESHTAGGLNAHYNQRRGYFGEYLFDTPTTTYLKVIDAAGNPFAGAQVAFYQKDGVTEYIDNVPEIEGVTDAQGQLLLPNRSVIPVATATGHTLHPNPFGQIHYVGTNGTMFVKVTRGTQEYYSWLFIHDLNLAYWAGYRDTALCTVIPTLPGQPPHESLGASVCQAIP